MLQQLIDIQSVELHLAMPVLCYVILPLAQTNTPLWVIVDVAMVLGGLGAGASAGASAGAGAGGE